jgi:predicted GNAT family acetyltransferase
MDIDVVHRPDLSRFEAEVDGDTAFLAYEQTDNVVVMTHTIVPPQLEGKGVAGRLATTAVAWARGEGLDVDPRCSYVRSWLEKHG